MENIISRNQKSRNFTRINCEEKSLLLKAGSLLVLFVVAYIFLQTFIT